MASVSMEIMIKIVKNHQLYFNAIIQFSNLILTIFPPILTANNELIFLSSASLYSTSQCTLQTDIYLKKLKKNLQKTES